ncbi:MAG: hypothetical protein ABF370_04525, partial [Verrucomicrobiales bacterium]
YAPSPVACLHGYAARPRPLTIAPRACCLRCRGPEPIYELLGTNDARDSEERDWVECYEKALNLYRAKEFDQALAVIEALLETTPSDISMQRLSALCKECRVHLPDDWDGVTRFYQK